MVSVGADSLEVTVTVVSERVFFTGGGSVCSGALPIEMEVEELEVRVDADWVVVRDEVLVVEEAIGVLLADLPAEVGRVIVDLTEAVVAEGVATRSDVVAVGRPIGEPVAAEGTGTVMDMRWGMGVRLVVLRGGRAEEEEVVDGRGITGGLVETMGGLEVAA